MSPSLETLANLITQYAFWSAVAFIIVYTLLAKWWKSEIGWARVSLDGGIALALSPTVAHFIFGLRVDNSTFFDWYAIAAVALVGCVSLWNTAIVIRKQIRGHLDGEAAHRNPGAEG